MQLTGRKLIGVVLLVVVIASAILVSALYLISRGGTPTATASRLPPGCVKPADGFLIIASSLGYNDSIGHGAPTNPWPMINVTVGSTVHIVVCNTDFQAHGFQVSHYYEGSIYTVEPGQILDVSFVADQVGTFRIYCNIFCTIHIFMQSGQLRVTA